MQRLAVGKAKLSGLRVKKLSYSNNLSHPSNLQTRHPHAVCFHAGSNAFVMNYCLGGNTHKELSTPPQEHSKNKE